MKDALTSFDLRALVAEWQALDGGDLGKGYHARGEREPAPPPAVRMARGRPIDNARLETVEQRGFDRVAVFTFQKENAFQLVFEMFGKGNVVLVTGGNTV